MEPIDKSVNTNCPKCKRDTLIKLSDGIYCMDVICDYYKPNQKQ